MRSARTVLAAALGALAWLGCADDPAGPEPNVVPDSPELILSNPVDPVPGPAFASIAGSGMTPVVFISLSPGTFPEAEFVIIRNSTTAGAAGLVVPVVDGGFDPVMIVADAGDRLELEFYAGGAVLGRKHGTVPRSRPPTIVRIDPPKGRTDVALAARPTVIFSEPVDPASLEAAVRLRRAGALVAGEAGALPSEPWVVQFIPDALLDPQSVYELEIGEAVRDLDGDALEAGLRSSFTTAAATPPPPPPPGPLGPERIAFTSTRDGEPFIYLAHVDGSGLRRLVSGSAPAWSWDGRRIAFQRAGAVHVINADGTGERRLTAGTRPSWSPDDAWLVYTSSEGIAAVSATGATGGLLLPHGSRWLGQPVWSPDGQRIAFLSTPTNSEEAYPADIWQIYVMNADGTDPRPLVSVDDAMDWSKEDPSWSPEGTGIAFGSSDASWGEEPTPLAFVVASLARDGTGGRSIHFRGPSTSSGREYAGNPDWSPDGRRLAFSRQTAEPVGDELFPLRIFVVETETGIAQQLIPDATGPGVIPNYRDDEVAWSRVTP